MLNSNLQGMDKVVGGTLKGEFFRKTDNWKKGVLPPSSFLLSLLDTMKKSRMERGLRLELWKFISRV